MDGKGLRALICVLVVVGCSIALVWSASAAVVAADAGAEQAPLQIDDQSAEQEQGQVYEQIQETPPESDQLDDADEVHISIAVHEDGSATFDVEYRFEGNSDDWDSLEEDVEENSEAYAANEAAGWDETLGEGENATDREMDLSNTSVTTDTEEAPQSLGYVEFSFEWSSFAYGELNRIEAGDALAGFTLADDTTLRVFPPEDYAIKDVDPSPSPDEESEDSVFWNGDEIEFTDEQPSIVMIENGDEATEPTDAEDGPEMPWLIVLAALSLLAAVGAAGWWFRRRSGRRAPAEPTDSGAEPAPATEEPAEATEPTEPPEPEGPPPELLSNEEHVLQLLEAHGGRIKQQQVVSELDWTEAKTSQVVGGLREDDEIDVFRIGRENVLALPDEADQANQNEQS